MKNDWLKHLKEDPIPWLLESNPWAKYRTIIDLQEKAITSKEAKDAKNGILKSGDVQQLVKETTNWIEIAPTRNNDPEISYFKLRMLTDFGLTIKDDGIKEITEKATAYKEDSFFAVRGKPPERPKKGEKYVKPDPKIDEWHACPCTSPVITYSLLNLGLKNKDIQKSVDELKNRWETKQGWFCHFFFVESMFKKLQIGCPMAGLMALEVFSLIPELKESKYAKNAYATIKFHKEYGKSIYYFGRSKKFFTLKYPFVWYNALYMADVLTRFNFCKKDKLVKELVEWIEKSQDNEGRFKPTSIFMKYKGWDFANKKEPSPWITYLCCKILKQFYG